MRPSRWVRAVLLYLLIGLSQVALAQAAKHEPPKSHRAEHPDAGTGLSEEDLEVLKNLELLEHLGESDDLELLLALSDPD